ncbi:hypothetical protein BSAF29S_03870 [Bacillus safensis subsp. safensis]
MRTLSIGSGKLHKIGNDQKPLQWSSLEKGSIKSLLSQETATVTTDKAKTNGSYALKSIILKGLAHLIRRTFGRNRWCSQNLKKRRPEWSCLLKGKNDRRRGEGVMRKNENVWEYSLCDGVHGDDSLYYCRVVIKNNRRRTSDLRL